MLFNNWNDLANPQRLDLVFDGKNQAYGAYVIRRDYNNRLAKALLITLTFVMLIIAIPYVYRLFSGSTTAPVSKVVDPVILEGYSVPQQPAKPPPPAEPSNPKRSTIGFTKPTVTDDDLITDAPPTQIEAGDGEVSNKTVTGDNSGEATPVEKIIAPPVEPTPLSWAQVMPEFPGGEAALLKFIRDNTRYSEFARTNGIEGTVFISFVVDTEGRIINPEILRGVHPALDREVLQAIISMPRWKPGQQNGKTVSVYYRMPVSFRLVK